MGLGQAAKVLGRTDFQHVHTRGNQVDYGLETLVVQRVGQQPFGWIVGGDQHPHATLEKGFEQPGNQHGIADVVHVELVETQHAAAVEQLVQGHGQGIVRRLVRVHTAVQSGEKLMEMHALFLGDGQRLEETVQQPAFATSHRAVQVQAAGRLAGEQVPGLARHRGDGLGLTSTEGVTQLSGFVLKERLDGRVVQCVGFFTEQTTDKGEHGQCESLCSAVVAYFRAPLAI